MLNWISSVVGPELTRSNMSNMQTRLAEARKNHLRGYQRDDKRYGVGA